MAFDEGNNNDGKNPNKNGILGGHSCGILDIFLRTCGQQIPIHEMYTGVALTDCMVPRDYYL